MLGPSAPDPGDHLASALSTGSMRIIAVVSSALLLMASAISHSWGQAPSLPSKADQEKAVRTVVTEFGKRLRMVAILAPKEMVVAAMDQEYSAYVAANLLATWKNNPEIAPGKRTSSPSPERIDISSIEATGPNSYAVTGEVILLTAQERREGGVFQANPVTMIVARQHGNWVITAYAEKESSP